MKGRIHLIEADLAGCETFHQDHGDWFYVEYLICEAKLADYLAKVNRFRELHGD